VLTAPSTTSALGSFNILPTSGSTLYVLGIHGDVSQWLRPVQMLGGIMVGVLVARRGHWWAAPLAGLAIRVATDPYAWLYYALGPICFALLWETAGVAEDRPQRRAGLLVWSTLCATFLLPAAAMELGKRDVGWAFSVAATAKLGWAAVVVLAALRPRPGGVGPVEDEGPSDAGARLPAQERRAFRSPAAARVPAA
jgi:hypothetical protein